MIAFAEKSASRPPRATAAPPQPARIAQPLQGPDRAVDPVDALARDIAELAGAGGADEAALICRGWSVGEIIEHGPAAALRLRQGCAR